MHSKRHGRLQFLHTALTPSPKQALV